MIEALSEVVAALNARAHSASRGRQAVLFVVPLFPSRFGVSGESRCGTATSRVTCSVLSIRIPARPAGVGGGVGGDGERGR